jgi:hypothetical protein
LRHPTDENFAWLGGGYPHSLRLGIHRKAYRLESR